MKNFQTPIEHREKRAAVVFLILLVLLSVLAALVFVYLFYVVLTTPSFPATAF